MIMLLSLFVVTSSVFASAVEGEFIITTIFSFWLNFLYKKLLTSPVNSAPYLISYPHPTGSHPTGSISFVEFSSSSDIPNVIEHGKTGYLVPEKDAARLTETLQHIADHFEDTVPMVQKAYEGARSRFDSRTNHRILEALLSGR